MTTRRSERAAGSLADGKAKAAWMRQKDLRVASHLADAAAELGAIPAGPLPDELSGTGPPSPDPLDLVDGLHPVGGKPPPFDPSRPRLPGETVAVGRQARAALDCLKSASAEEGLAPFRTCRMQPLALPEDVAALMPLEHARNLIRQVVVDLTGHNRRTVLDALIREIHRSALSGHKPTRKGSLWIDSARAARWEETISGEPETDRLRERLEEAAGPPDDAAHVGRWFRRTAGLLIEAAYDSKVPVSVLGIDTRPSGFQTTWRGESPAMLAENPGYTPGPGIAVSTGHYQPEEFVEHAIDAILHGNLIEEDSDERRRLERALRSSVIAGFTPMPDYPDIG